MNDLHRVPRGQTAPLRQTHISRRSLLAAGSASLLTACGGGGGGSSAPGEPAIDQFAADPPQVFVGESTELVVAFHGGAATLWPQNVPVASGTRIATGVLASAATFTLRVRSAAGTGVDASVTVPVSYRDRYASAAAPFVASEHTASLARDGSVIVIGGSRAMSTSSDSIDRFDPVTRTFSQIGSLASGRATHRATSLAAGGILVTGGSLTQVDGRLVERVDDLTGRAEAVGTMSVSRLYHAAVELADGRVLVTGGNAGGENAPAGISRSAELWDPATRRFRRLASAMQVGRSAHSMTLLPDGRVLVAGGYAPPGPYVFAEIFDPATERFEPLAGPNEVRASHAAHLVGGRVLLLGGERPDADGVTPIPLASVLGFDPTSGTFASLPELAAPRTWAASVALPSGAVLLHGGQRQVPEYTASAERYEPATGGHPIAALDGPRALHSATRLADGRVLVLGGEGLGGAYCSSALLYE